MKKYKYKVLELKEKGLFVTKLNLLNLEEQLNFEGEQGWELITSFSTDLDSNGRKEVVLIFRKEI